MSSPANPSDSTLRAVQRAPIVRWKLVALIIVLAVVAAILWKLPVVRAQAQAGSAYAARVGCACRFVEGRPIGSCGRDFEPGMEAISIAEVPERRAVRGYVPLLASRTAHYAGKSGCLLDPE